MLNNGWAATLALDFPWPVFLGFCQAWLGIIHCGLGWYLNIMCVWIRSADMLAQHTAPGLNCSCICDLLWRTRLPGEVLTKFGALILSDLSNRIKKCMSLYKLSNLLRLVQCIKYLFMLFFKENVWFGYCFSLLYINNYNKTCSGLIQTLYVWSQFCSSGFWEWLS